MRYKITFALLCSLIFIPLHLYMPDTKNPFKDLYKPQTSKTRIPFLEGKDMLGFFDEWLNSSEYKNRIENNGYDKPDQIIGNRVNSLNNLNLTFNPNQRSEANAPSTPQSPSYVNINKQELNKLNIPVNTGMAHELSHIIGAKTQGQNNVVGFNDNERSKLTNAISKKQPVISGVQDSDEYNRTSKEFNNWKYLQKPEEIKADLDASRFNLFDKGIYDIREGQPFTQEHLDNAKPSLQEDDSFNRLLQQVGDENYIELMNTIAMNKKDKNTSAKFGGLFESEGGGANPFSMGASLLSGFIPTEKKNGLTSIGGSTAKGAISGAAAGATFGLPGALVGAGIGGLTSFIGAKTEQAEQIEARTQANNDATRRGLANLNYGVGQASNLPMAYGGNMDGNVESMVGSFSSFEAGGTHENSPHGVYHWGLTLKGE